jgi:tripeptide aminopeptidase
VGELEYENFNAAEANHFQGKVYIRLCQRKNDYFDYRQFYQYFKRRNTPRDKGYEGFFHVNHLTGSIEETILELIIRDHSKQKFEKRKNLIEKITKKIEVC